jgi:hypothetical protein
MGMVVAIDDSECLLYGYSWFIQLSQEIAMKKMKKKTKKKKKMGKKKMKR